MHTNLNPDLNLNINWNLIQKYFSREREWMWPYQIALIASLTGCLKYYFWLEMQNIQVSNGRGPNYWIPGKVNGFDTVMTSSTLLQILNIEFSLQLFIDHNVKPTIVEWISNSGLQAW